MARPKLRCPDQPPVVRLLLGLYEAAASLKLAVVVIGLSAIMLGWATFIESWYGTEAVSFGIYGSWWFSVLLGLLGLNVLCAALIRFPWKKHQIGFLITHTGILVLLLGCLIQRVAGVDAQMVIDEGNASNVAFESQKHFLLLVSSTDRAASGSEPEHIKIPFRCGPFNWEDYDRLFFFPWRLARRDRGVIYNRDGIELEVLDYYSGSKQQEVPRIALRVGPALGSRDMKMGPDASGAPIELTVRRTANPHGAARPFGVGDTKQTPFGPAVAFWMSGSRAETEAFLDSRPEGPLGALGQVVLHAQGKTFRFPADQLQKQPRQPLGETGLEVEFVQTDPRFRGIHLQIRSKDAAPAPMLLYADMPHFNSQDYRDGVFGTYWLAPAAPAADQKPSMHDMVMQSAARLRIDMLQGDDQKLYYREWASPEVVAAAPWPAAEGDSAGPAATPVGTEVVAFRQTPVPLSLRLERFDSSDKPDVRVEPLPFRKGRRAGVPRARVRLTVDGKSDEFWLRLRQPIPGMDSDAVENGDRRAEVILTQERIDLGFQLYLHKFTRKLDPGSDSESHFSSLVDVEGPGPDAEKLRENVLITMNQPLTTTDPNTGRSYRVYQADFNFVAKPGDRDFTDLVYAGRPISKITQRDDLYNTVLSVNYDPGRGIKYAGCLLVIAGIVTMFYMRAYFFRGRGTQPEKQGSTPPARQVPQTISGRA